MKYCNSLKYVGGFERAENLSAISAQRVRALCEKLGRINLGARYICLPEGSAGHAAAVMLESVMTHAGHNVGRIRLYECSPRDAVFSGGAIPSIEDFGAAVAELKSAVQRLPEERFCLEEICFVLGLLLCRMSGCEYIILEGMKQGATIECVLSPYEIIVIPSVYSSSESERAIKSLCEAIRRGTREVVSGNQKSEVYNLISRACANSGAKLSIPVKVQFEVKELTSRSLTFDYCGREGFTMRSPSRLMRDVAMTVIESALALRRGGVKLPWSSISAGIGVVSGTGCFDVVSLSPLILMDTAGDACEVELLAETAREVWGEDALADVTVFTTESAAYTAKIFGEETPVTVCGGEGATEGAQCFGTPKECAKALLALNRRGGKAICYGSVEFAEALKTEFFKLL